MAETTGLITYAAEARFTFALAPTDPALAIEANLDALRDVVDHPRGLLTLLGQLAAAGVLIETEPLDLQAYKEPRP